jgi:predicted regulator of Ras-like GTPase activity (Roadblock/LC7/MglB family)
VGVTNGNFQVILGYLTPLGLDFSAQYWLGVTVDADTEMAPRQALAMVPYAYRAVTAVTADNLSGSATIQGSQVTGTIAGATISGGTLTQLQGQFVGALQPSSVAANTLTAVDSAGNVGYFASIAIGADGLPVIAYYDGISVHLKVAKCANAACTASTLSTVDSDGDVGWYTSTAIGADALPVIAYYDATNGDLKVAKCVNAACSGGASTLSTVDSDGNVGQYTSIAIGADALPVIAYWDATNTNLKVAKCVDAACTGTSTLSTVDSSGVVGLYPSIAIGADGLPVIAYYDSTNSNLKVAKCATAACSGGTSALSTVDSAGTVGEYTSIAIGVDGLPVIAYRDGSNTNLKVAKCANAACAGGTSTLSTVDSAGDVGWYASIAIGADALPVMAYFDNSNLDLKVAKCVNAACSGGTSTLSTVDSAGDVGGFASIAIGADGLPVMAYFDNSDFNLKAAKCANPICAPYFWRR